MWFYKMDKWREWEGKERKYNPLGLSLCRLLATVKNSLLRSCLKGLWDPQRHRKYNTVSFSKRESETLTSITNELSESKYSLDRSQRKGNQEVYESLSKANKSFSTWVSQPQSAHQMQPDGWVLSVPKANRITLPLAPHRRWDTTTAFPSPSFLQTYGMCPTQYFHFSAFPIKHWKSSLRSSVCKCCLLSLSSRISYSWTKV